MEDSQYLPLTTCPSLAFISLHDSAGSSGMEPRGTEETKKIQQNKTHRTSAKACHISFYQFTSIHCSSVIISVSIRNELLRSGFLRSITELTHPDRDHKVETLTAIVFLAG